MNPDELTLTILPPELFPVIAAFVPLRSAPHTLRALALANHHCYNICRPILYSRLVLRNEQDATGVIRRIINDPQLGLYVTELYIMSALSVKARKGKKPLNVVTGLRFLVAKGLIPRITALGLYLLKDWIYDEHFKPILCGRLLAGFWINLRNKCPRLRTLLLRNVGHSFMAPWLKGPVIDEISNLPASNCIAADTEYIIYPAFQDLSVLCLEWSPSEGPEDDDALKILNNLPRLASSLHTLSLTTDFQPATVLLSLDFPHLKFLRLHDFKSLDDTEKVQGFFQRHPQLENLSLESCIHTWFSKNMGLDFYQI
jgi:hypothetical protein